MDICFYLCSCTTLLRFFYVAFSAFSIVVSDYMSYVSSATIAYFDAVSVEAILLFFLFFFLTCTSGRCNRQSEFTLLHFMKFH